MSEGPAAVNEKASATRKRESAPNKPEEPKETEGERPEKTEAAEGGGQGESATASKP